MGGTCKHGAGPDEVCADCLVEVCDATRRAFPLPSDAKTIDDTLAERGSRYGSFDGHARITQGIKQAMIDSPKWQALDCDMREALEMIAHKVGRILNGDPFYHDSWHDIVGYAKLVADRLEPEQ